MIPEAAVEAAAEWLPHDEQCEVRPERDCTCWQPRVNLMRAALEAAYPILAAQVLRDAVDAFPLETITAPDNAVVWLMRRAEQIEAA